MIKICKTCGKSFNARLNKIKFCSIQCYAKSRIKPREKCIVCGKEFYAVPYRIKKGMARFCSLQCAGIAKRGISLPKTTPMPSCADCPNWKGNNASSNAIHKWIYRVKGKPLKCEHCGETTGRLHWANTNNHQYTHNANHFISLCTSCHHKYDGTSDITRKKMSLAKIGTIPWNKGKKLHYNVWNKGLCIAKNKLS